MADYWLTNIKYNSRTMMVTGDINHVKNEVTITNPTDKVIYIKLNAGVKSLPANELYTFTDVSSNPFRYIEFRKGDGWDGESSIDYIKAIFPTSPPIDKLPSTATLGEYTSKAQELYNMNVSNKSKLKTHLIAKGVGVLETDKLQDLIGRVSEIKGFPTGWDIEEVGEVYGSDVTEGDGVVWYRMADLNNGADLSLWQFPEQTAGSYSSRYCIGYSYDDMYVGFIVRGHLYIYKKDISSGEYNWVFTADTQAYWFDWHPTRHEFMLVTSTAVKFFKFDGKEFIKLTTELAGGGFYSTFEYCKYSPTGEYFHIESYASTKYCYLGTITELGDIRKLTRVVVPSSTSWVGNGMFSPDGKFVYCCVGNQIRIFRVDGGSFTFIHNITLSTKVYYLDISFNGDYLIATYADTPFVALFKINKETGMLTSITGDFTADISGARHCKFSPTSNHVVIRATSGSVNAKNTVKIYAIENDKLVEKPSVSNADYFREIYYSTIGFSHNGKEMMIVDDKVFLYDLSGRQVVCNYNLPNQPLLKISDKRFGMANETKTIGSQCKVTLFPKLNMLGEVLMTRKIEELENRIITLEESDKAILRGDMQTVAYNNYPEDFEDIKVTNQDIATLEER